jgi:hypothetical protein
MPLECSWAHNAHTLHAYPRFLTPDMAVVSDSLSSTLGPRYRRLHELISSLVCPPPCIAIKHPSPPPSWTRTAW